MATLFETAMRGYALAEQMMRDEIGYDAAVEKYGEGPASAPGLFGDLQSQQIERQRESRAAQQQQFNQQMETRADRREQAEFNVGMSQTEITQRESGMRNLVQGLIQARDDPNQDLAETFDQMSRVLPNLGVSEEDIPILREQMLANPNILDTYAASLGASGSGSDAKTTAASVREAEKQRERRDAAENQLLKLDDVFDRIETLQDPARQQAAKAVFGLPGAGKLIFSGGFGGVMDPITGSDAASYNQLLEGLQGDLSSQAFETLKGGGPITEAETRFATQAIANLSREMSYEDYQTELANLKNYMARLREVAQRRLTGEDVPEIVDPKGNLTEGGYTRRSGNPKQIYPGFVHEQTGEVFQGGDPGNPDNWKLQGSE